MVKEIKFLKHKFFKNDDANGGAMASAIADCPDSHIVIHSQTQKHGRIWGHASPTDVLKMIEKNNGIYEVITKYPHKVYFDVDKKDYDVTKAMEYLNEVKQTIATFFPNCDCTVSGSITEKKTSFHIVLNNYTIHNDDERQQVKHIAHHIRDNIDEGFDWTVYTKNRNMKAINQSKLDGRVQEIIEGDDYKQHLITCFINDYSLPFNNIPEPIKEKILIAKSKKSFDMAELPKLKLVCPEDADLMTMTPIDVLSLLPNTSSCNFTYRHLICRFCFTTGIPFETFLSWICQRFNGHCSKEKYEQWNTHWKNIEKFPPANIEKIKPILVHFYPHINKDLSYRQFSQTFCLPEDKIRYIETIDQSCFNNSEKYTVLNVGMGGGKTAQTITYLQNKPSFLWIAPNVALGHNTLKRFEDENIEAKHYANFKTKEKKDGILNTETKLIICLNSLHYLTDNDDYDIIVIDEIETLLDKFYGEFIDQGERKLKTKIWRKFLDLFVKAKKVIFLDAFITTKTYNFIQNLQSKDANLSVNIYKRTFEPQTRTVRYMNNFEMTIHDAIEKIKAGNKVFIYYPYKRDTSNAMSMERVYGILKEQTGASGVFYNADVGDKTKKELKDVNTSWADRKFVITNNIITCGINYENLDFDYKYLFVASFNTPRDIIQVSYRARYLSSGIINVCYMGKMNQTNSWINDTEQIGCDIYSNLYHDILVEKKAPLKRSFQLFCNKAHYRQVTDTKEIDTKIEKDINELLLKQNLGYSYSKIDDIDFSEAEAIEEKCFCQEATMYEKMCLKKYYFNKKFLDDARTAVHDEEKFLFDTETGELALTMSILWEKNLFFFVDRLKYLFSVGNTLFHQIQALNKNKTIFPNEIKKTKLNDDILDLIFKQFSFKFISRGSSTNKIIKEIYNTYFGCFIVNTEYDNNKHVSYTVANDFYKFYDFASKYLIINKELNLTNNNFIENDIDECAIEI